MTADLAVRAPAASPHSPRPARLRSACARARVLGWTLAGLAIAAALWSLIVATGRFPRQLFPSVPEILAAGHTLWAEGLLADDIVASLRRAAVGFAIGAAAGIVVAVFTATTAAGRNLLQPVLRVFSPIPTIGLVPLAILWFGLGENSKLLVIALGVFVPVWINSHSGLAGTPIDYLKAARCLGAGRWQTLSKVVLPEAAPDIASGLRVGAAMAFVLIVVAEMTGTTAGIGYRISQAQLFSQADRLIFCLIILGIVGALCDLLVAAAASPFTRWAQEER
ncbi:ABC transporter permease [Mycolicibacterium conceptionense]|jgi:sulfonate transport system permease protein|uniref:ABC transporter permease n=2 Tax=Mycolicibacterium TaxID=1866885 RepID=A0ABR5FWI2_9MYCO|nr:MULTISPECIES: ABC transporter permease [Mycolicibacterium]KLI05175.1 ABC transporter permease [Mycolicibacterium senegalense]KLO52315.1 ABC transporter permease [Mycolicibacterium senegalense]KMV16628.1 ABC transporter permease [Mycolicibacterium conceptionense]OMB87584.1 ABC transporter permease [Mycolicibacterium conceptionense]